VVAVVVVTGEVLTVPRGPLTVLAGVCEREATAATDAGATEPLDGAEPDGAGVTDVAIE
jgi:hypothetical protein